MWDVSLLAFWHLRVSRLIEGGVWQRVFFWKSVVRYTIMAWACGEMHERSSTTCVRVVIVCGIFVGCVNGMAHKKICPHEIFEPNLQTCQSRFNGCP